MTMVKRKNSKGIGGHQQPHHGRTDEWLTPPEIVKALGEFDLDPCCPPNMPWYTAKQMVSRPADGLSIDWEGRVWLNPPYGDSAAKWVEKMASHANGVLLIFARTETNWWHDHIWPHATAILFLRQRIHFHMLDGKRAPFNAGAPSALVAYGEENAWSLLRSGINGKVVVVNDFRSSSPHP